MSDSLGGRRSSDHRGSLEGGITSLEEPAAAPQSLSFELICTYFEAVPCL